jgi:hypothetical protein
MPEFQVRRDVVVGSRREGRRSLSAYNAQARGLRDLVESDRGGRPEAQARRMLARRDRPAGIRQQESAGFNAGVALALVYPLMWRARLTESGSGPRTSGNEGASMKRKPIIKSLENVSLEEAVAYLDHSSGDELNAAYALAIDRARLDGSHGAPDDAEVHHALFLLCRARGKHPPSFDEMRVELRRRIAA